MLLKEAIRLLKTKEVIKELKNHLKLIMICQSQLYMVFGRT